MMDEITKGLLEALDPASVPTMRTSKLIVEMAASGDVIERMSKTLTDDKALRMFTPAEREEARADAAAILERVTEFYGAVSDELDRRVPVPR